MFYVYLFISYTCTVYAVEMIKKRMCFLLLLKTVLEKMSQIFFCFVIMFIKNTGPKVKSNYKLFQQQQNT